VSKAHRYEPLLNRTYEEMASHYGTAILPARAGKPRDKAKVEVGVQIAERWIAASLRNHRFTSLAEANTAIRGRLEWLNNRPFAKLDGTRQALFEQLDRPAMRPLPTSRYECATWKTAKVNIDYHVESDRHYYSVPHQLVGAPARPPPNSSKRSWPAGRTPNRATAPVWASFGSRAATAPNGSKPPPDELWSSARGATAASSPSWLTVSKRHRYRAKQRRSSRHANTNTYAAPPTTSSRPRPRRAYRPLDPDRPHPLGERCSC
jgi:hypothetical protein